VNRRLSSQKKAKVYRSAAFVLVPVIVAGLCVLAWVGLGFIGEQLFSKSDRFRIVDLDIKGGEVITPELIREYTQIHEGMNLFGFDGEKIRGDFLRRAPNVKSLEISRHLPDALRIAVIERVPLARMGTRGHLVADREGVVFGLHSRSSGLPVIDGYKGSRLRPGSRISGLAMAALQVLEVCDSPALGLRVEVVETNHEDRLVLRLPGRVSVKLSWPGMGEETPESRKHLLTKLARIVRTLQSRKGRRLRTLDATHDDDIYGR